ncbi:hypothetical protein [Aquibacillus rhizosphaerae]|uniref:Uncharacterized protein n=1 Tax=Aquibacillus rhizosphaerae TaxID=3051431 RepID=A0ABT7L339_9BACI|nr:hypothetical protein [Aquibacillus sp. LR5S19]MDL4839600.1 hypothetical protein [Aquibacillus sp. LR5S19]
MKQAMYGLILFIFLILPPVATFLESIMIIHMHMQMPLLVFSGFLIARFFQIRFPQFFKNWNDNGIPGMLLFLIIWLYWMIPKAMDDALTLQFVEIFKFFSLTFLAGVPLRDSWGKLGSKAKSIVYVFFTLKFIIMGYLYIGIESQICNNYLIIEQRTLGWGSLAFAACFILYGFYWVFTDQSEFKTT